jgi:hypothetical protein
MGDFEESGTQRRKEIQIQNQKPNHFQAGVVDLWE